MKLNEAAYFMRYGLESLVMRKRKPIAAGIPLTDICNLQCKHCVVANVGRGHYPFEKIEGLLNHFYNIGARIIYFQGGEVMMWRDGQRTLNDVIRRAREIGIFRIAVVTNGTIAIDSEADLMWVSMDGSEETHDSIRGEGAFTRLRANLDRTTHPHVSANMTVNRMNEKDLETVAAFVRAHPKLKGLSVNFHIPYPGVEDLALPLDERAIVIERVKALKKQGYPILNTNAGLNALATNRWKRPVPMIHLVEQDHIFECCWGRETPGVCEKCGYGAIAEMSRILDFDIGAMIGSVSLFK